VNSSQLSALSSQERQKQTVLRWIKFNAVGGIGIIVQLAALSIFRDWLKLDYLLSTGLAVEIAVIHNFLWHERFTWADRPAARPTQSLARLAKFNASNGTVSIVGIVLLTRVLVGEIGLNYVASNLFAIAVCSLVNFLMGDRIVFQAGDRDAVRRGGRMRPPLRGVRGKICKNSLF
jgi:putative flippase GtrA